MCSTLRDTRKKSLSSHNVLASHLRRLLPMIYRSWHTNFISSFSPEVTMYDVSVIKNKDVIHSLERSNDNKLTTRLPLWSFSVEESIYQLQPKFWPNRNPARLMILVLFWLSWFAGQSSFNYRKRHFLDIRIWWRSRRFPFGSSFTLHSLKLRSFDRFS